VATIPVSCPTCIQEQLRDRIAKLEKERDEAKKAAVCAYVATHREGWERGLSTEDAWTRVTDCLGNLGLMTMDEMMKWLDAATDEEG
jgi:hypothetical protein